jgi:hypothetical protein
MWMSIALLRENMINHYGRTNRRMKSHLLKLSGSSQYCQNPRGCGRSKLGMVGTWNGLYHGNTRALVGDQPHLLNCMNAQMEEHWNYDGEWFNGRKGADF